MFRLENSQTPASLARIIRALGQWLGDPEHASLRRAFTVWLARTLLPRRLPQVTIPEVNDLEEMRTMLAERVKEWTRDWREQGRKEGQTVLLERQLAKRFGPLPEWAAQRLDGASEQELDTWAERVLDAQTLEAVFDTP